MQSSACNSIKKETLAQVFFCEFCEIVKNAIFIEHPQWLLLHLAASYGHKKHHQRCLTESW